MQYSGRLAAEMESALRSLLSLPSLGVKASLRKWNFELNIS